MRVYPGTDKRDPDAITRIDYFLRDVDAAIRRLGAGQEPTGSGAALPASTPDLSQYLYMPGRSGGQHVYGGTATGEVLILTSNTGLATDAPSMSLGVDTALFPGDQLRIVGTSYLGGSYVFQVSNGGEVYFKDQQVWFAAGASLAAGGVLNVRGSEVVTGKTSIASGYPIVKIEQGTASLGAITLSVDGISSQTGHLTRWKNAAGNYDTYIDKDGKFVGDGSLLTGLPSQTSDLLSATHTDTTAAACTAGNVIYGVGATPKWTSGTPDAAGLVALAGTQTLTGQKTFPEGANAPTFVQGEGPATKAFNITNNAAVDIEVRGAGSGTCTLVAGTMVPNDITFITQTATAGLSNEQALGTLATGLLKNTTGTGVLSIAAASDLPAHTHASGQGGNINCVFDSLIGAANAPFQWHVTPVAVASEFAVIYDDETTNALSLSLDGSLSAGASLVFPAAGGAVVCDSAVMNITQKTFTGTTTLNAASTNIIKCNTTGPRFQNASTTAQYMRFDLSGLSAARDKKFLDISGSPVECGAVAVTSGAACVTGKMGTMRVSLQATSMAAATAVSAAYAGMYRFTAYLQTTASAASGTVSACLNYNDGVAQTNIMVPTFNNAGTLAGLALASASGMAQGGCAFYSAAGANIVVFTSADGIVGTPGYIFNGRFEYLGA